MKYEFAKQEGNKIIGLSIHLGPKQRVRDYITVLGPWAAWVQHIRDQMDAKSTLIDNPVEIDVEINHGGQGLQQISFEQFKTMLFGDPK